MQGTVKYVGAILFIGISFAVPFEMFSTIAMAIICIIFSVSLLKGHIFEKIFISVFIMAVVILIATGTALIFGHITSTDVLYIFARLDPVRMIAMVTTKVILFAVTRLVLHLLLLLPLSQ